MTGGVSRKSAKFSPPTSTPSISPLSTWYVNKALQRSSVAFPVKADHVHGHTASQEHDSKYVPVKLQAIMNPPLTDYCAKLGAGRAHCQCWHLSPPRRRSGLA